MKSMNKFYGSLILISLLIISIACESETSEDQNVINLSGNWKFQIDSLDVGVNQQWFSNKLEDTMHPAFQEFPTKYHSNWQWWDAMSHSSAIKLSELSSDINPIVRVIDDWFKARSLGLMFECKVGKGKLMITSIDLLSDTEKRPEA